MKKITKRMPRQKREKQLLEVALGLFIQNGYQGTSMEDIASAAGVTRPIVYNHFGSKDGIYLACLKDARASMNHHILQGVMSANEGPDKLRGGIDGYFCFVEENREAWHLLFGGGVAIAGTAAEEATRMRFQTVEQITNLFAERSSMPKERIEAFAHAISGAGEQIAKWWIRRPEIPRAHVVDHMHKFTAFGLNDIGVIATQ